MERSSIKLMAAAMLISVMLTGCGSKNEAQSIDSGQAENQGADGQMGAGSDDSELQQPDRTADYFAKVVKVSGNSIIIQKSTMSPADMPSFGGGRPGGQRMRGGNGNGGQGGTGPSDPSQGGPGQFDPGQGDPSQGDPGQGGDSGQVGNGSGANRPGGGRFGGGFMNQMKFEDDQITVPVNADTEIVKFSRGQNGMTTDSLKVSDLQADDIVMVWLESDNKTAQYIRLQFNPANMGNPGKAGNGQ